MEHPNILLYILQKFALYNKLWDAVSQNAMTLPKRLLFSVINDPEAI